jgi:hypothetical protein
MRCDRAALQLEAGAARLMKVVPNSSTGFRAALRCTGKGDCMTLTLRQLASQLSSSPREPRLTVRVSAQVSCPSLNRPHRGHYIQGVELLSAQTLNSNKELTMPTTSTSIALADSHSSLRLLSAVALFAGSMFGLLAGCGGDMPPTGGSDVTNPPPSDMNPPPPPPPPAFTWVGTWNATVSYTSSCTFGGGSPNTAAVNHTNALEISGNGSTGYAGYLPTTYNLQGTGDSTSLTLSGKYPVRDFQGNTAGTFVANYNMITLKLDTIVSDKKVTGKISGTFKTNYTCSVQNGTITLTR